MKKGSFVKIEDIGPLAKVLMVKDGMILAELEGERFWIPDNLVSEFVEAA